MHGAWRAGVDTRGHDCAGVRGIGTSMDCGQTGAGRRESFSQPHFQSTVVPLRRRRESVWPWGVCSLPCLSVHTGVTPRISKVCEYP